MNVNSQQRRPIGVAPLTALDATVEEYVVAAAKAGFELLGLRPHPVLSSDPEFPAVGSQRFADLKTLIADNGLAVLDIEVFSVKPGTGRDSWLPVIEAGQELGARFMNIVGEYPDLAAFEDIVGEITQDAKGAEIVPVLEPVAYRPLNDFAQAVEIAQSVGCKVELDMLHFMRTGCAVELIAEHRDMFPIFQLCDAPRDIQSIRDELLPFASSENSLDLQIAESRGMRQLAGEGDAPIAQLLELVGPDAMVGVEIPNSLVRGDLDVTAYFALVAQQSRNFLATHVDPSFA